MSNTSKKYFEENFKEKIWEELIKQINQVKSETQMTSILSDVLTPRELNLLEKRLAIIYLLKQGLSYRKICEFVDVYCNTISFVKNGFKKETKIKKINRENKSGHNIIVEKQHKRRPRYPTYKGKGRWRFLNTL